MEHVLLYVVMLYDTQYIWWEFVLKKKKKKKKKSGFRANNCFDALSSFFFITQTEFRTLYSLTCTKISLYERLLILLNSKVRLSLSKQEQTNIYPQKYPFFIVFIIIFLTDLSAC